VDVAGIPLVIPGDFGRRSVTRSNWPDLEFVRREFLNLERDFAHGVFKRLDPRGEFSDHY
jgi:hypothetical protein